jgi:hypothetical protein
MRTRLAFGGVVALILMGAGILLAQSDPVIGTWKLNLAKSKFTAGAPPKEQTVTLVQAGDQYQVTISGTAPDGTPFSGKYSIPMKGGAGKVLAGPYDAVSSKRMNDNTLDVSDMKGGKEVMHIHVVVSKDGKTQTGTAKGVDLLGKPVAAVGVYDKE